MMMRWFRDSAARWLLGLLGVLLALLLLSSCTRNGYSYREANRTERRYNHVVRYYRRQSRQINRELRRDHLHQQRELQRTKPTNQSKSR